MQAQRPDRDILISKLETIPILSGLDPSSLVKLAQSAVRRVYTPGAVIFLEGEEALGVYCVDEGWVKVVKMALDGREQILYYWGSGDIFGGIGIYVDRPIPATAIALEETAIWVLPRVALQQMFRANPAMALPVIEFMANRIGELTELVADLSLRTVTERLARLLLEQAEDDVIHRQRWATQSDMAARIGTVPDVLSRALRSLVEDEVIELSRHQIRILDRPGLVAKTTLSN